MSSKISSLNAIISNDLMLVGGAAHHTEPVIGGGIMTMDGGAMAGRVARSAVHENDA